MSQQPAHKKHHTAAIGLGTLIVLGGGTYGVIRLLDELDPEEETTTTAAPDDTTTAGADDTTTAAADDTTTAAAGDLVATGEYQSPGPGACRKRDGTAGATRTFTNLSPTDCRAKCDEIGVACKGYESLVKEPDTIGNCEIQNETPAKIANNIDGLIPGGGCWIKQFEATTTPAPVVEELIYPYRGKYSAVLYVLMAIGFVAAGLQHVTRPGSWLMAFLFFLSLGCVLIMPFIIGFYKKNVPGWWGIWIGYLLFMLAITPRYLYPIFGFGKRIVTEGDKVQRYVRDPFHKLMVTFTGLEDEVDGERNYLNDMFTLARRSTEQRKSSIPEAEIYG